MGREADSGWTRVLETDTVEFPLLGRQRQGRQRIPSLTILCHPKLGRVGETAWLEPLLEAGSSSNWEVLLSRLEPAFVPPGDAEVSPQPLADPYLSRRPFSLQGTDSGGVLLRRQQVSTELEVDGRPLGDELLLSAQDLRRGVVLMLAYRVTLLLHEQAAPIRRIVDGFGLVGASDAMQVLREEIRRVADLEIPVLIRGETGTGKELVARALHQASRRRRGPFVSVNMGAVPPTLAAAELFGSSRGAFTGAEGRREGFFGRAQGGTLFLDEVGETPPEVQVLLLRALEAGEVQAVGERPRQVDVRVIAATDANLEAAVGTGGFRAPLLHRLAGYEITAPPLRQRRDDFGRLLVHFLRQELEAAGQPELLGPTRPTDSPWLPASLVAELVAAPWPGNVRQLRNVARQLVVGSRSQQQARLSPSIRRMMETDSEQAAEGKEKPAGAEDKPAARREYRKPSDVTEDELLTALRAHRWKLKPTAVALGVSRTSLYALIDGSPNLRKAADLTRDEVLEGRDRHGGDLAAMAAELEVSQRGLQQRLRALGLTD